MTSSMNVAFIVGNRPQFMKAAIVERAWRKSIHKDDINMMLIHTGQHYDENLSGIFFKELGISEPKYNLKIGSGHSIEQITSIMKKLYVIFSNEKPNAVAVYGDTNSTIGAALAAVHLNIPVIHIEAGERLFVRQNQPEEINRVVTDTLSSLCLTASRKARAFLKQEGFNDTRIKFTGDTMYDLFLWAQEKTKNQSNYMLEKHNLFQENYVLSTLHRAENTDNSNRLHNLLSALDNSDLDVIFPLHPRTKNAIEKLGWAPKKALRFIEPCGYLDLIALLKNAKYTITDSGGLSRESYWAKKQSFVPMSAPPWAEIQALGWMTLVNPDHPISFSSDILTARMNNYDDTLFGDGSAGEKIISSIYKFITCPSGSEELWRTDRQ